MKQFNRIFALVLCTCMTVSGVVFSSSHPSSCAVYNISSTMSHGYKVAEAVNNNTSAVSDPYYNQQWALNNDGTFTNNDNDNNDYDNIFPDFPDEDFQFPDEDYQFPDIISFPGDNDVEIHMPGGNWEFHFKIHYKKSSYQDIFNPWNTVSAVKNIDIDAPEAWNAVSKSGKQVVVAVIDTGVDYTHEDLKNSIWTNQGEIPGDGIDNDKNGYVDDVYGWDFCNNKPFELDDQASEYEHGTHVAGIIAASLNDKGIAGVVGNSNVKIMSIKALGGSGGSGEVDSVINAIKYAQKMGASICNLSFGTETYSKKLKDVMADPDMLFVCAAGNANRSFEGSNTDKSPIYPASYDLDNIISVANLTYDGTLDTTSNYGKTTVDIAAPGSSIISTLPDNSYGFMSGTSMAAPMVSAVAAMVYSDSDVKISDVKGILLNSVKTLSSLKDKVATGGMVDAYNALTMNTATGK